MLTLTVLCKVLRSALYCEILTCHRCVDLILRTLIDLCVCVCLGAVLVYLTQISRVLAAAIQTSERPRCRCLARQIPRQMFSINTPSSARLFYFSRFNSTVWLTQSQWFSHWRYIPLAGQAPSNKPDWNEDINNKCNTVIVMTAG